MSVSLPYVWREGREGPTENFKFFEKCPVEPHECYGRVHVLQDGQNVQVRQDGPTWSGRLDTPSVQREVRVSSVTIV